MASYTIPEEIIGLPLFVPNNHDYFEIVEGGLPNGDPCLRVRGDISRSYKAFCRAPTTSPVNIMTNLTRWGFSCWLKAPSGDGTGGRFGRVILGVMNSSHAISTPNSDGFIALSAMTPDDTTLNFVRSTTSSGGSEFAVQATGIRDNTWKLICVNTADAANAGTMHVNNNSTAVSTDTQTAGAAPNGNMYLCIGSYAGPGASTDSFGRDFSIAKIAFHDHPLSQAERNALYGAMTTANAVSCTVNVAPGQADPATGGTVTFRVVFSESVSGFTNADVTIGGTAGATTAIVIGGVNTYDVSISGMTTPGTVTLDIPAGGVTGINGGTNLDSVAIDNSIAWS